MLNFKKSPLFISILAAISTQVNANTVVDSNKAGHTVVKMTNGVSQIDIETPNSDGVSMNYFEKFNVEGKGTIINNSNVDYNSVLAGKIEANKNLIKREADVAVMNVTGRDKTKLISRLEAASSKDLHVYIANESGILVDGASFENIQKLTLTTGVVDQDLTTRVRGGEVVISGKGLKGVKNLNLFTEVLTNNGKIAAGEKVTAILGKNDIDKDGNIIFIPSKVYVKASKLGKIYSEQIDVKATSPLLDVEIDELLAKNNINLDAKGKVTNKGNIVAQNKVTIKAKAFDNIGKVKFDKASYDLKWVTRDGQIVDVNFIKEVWNKTHKEQLTSKDTWLLMTGSLLNQWTYDESTYEKDGSIVKNFRKFLDNLNVADKNTVLSKEGIDLVAQKQRKSEFVNKGDIYATETNEKRILEAVAISKAKAKQAMVSANDVVITLDDLLQNKDAVISAKDSLKITARKVINSNSISGDILLQDGYENISWEVMPIYVEKRNFLNPKKPKKVIVDATYDIAYERGLVDEDSARKTKISAINTSAIKGKKVNINATEVELSDDINTGMSVQADKLTIDTNNLKLKGQEIKAKELTLNGKKVTLDSAVIKADKADLTVDSLRLNTLKTKEIVLKTDKEELTREVGSGSGIFAKNELNLTAKNVALESSILKSDGKLKITADQIDNDSSYLEKDYQSSYDISKSFRKIKHNEKTQVNAPSFIYAKDLDIDAKQLNTKGSHVVGTEYINIDSNIAKVDVATVKNELDKKVGIDNGILGENYKKVKKEEQKSIGSVVQSDGEIAAKIAKELIVVGSKIKGAKVKLESNDVTIASAKNNTDTVTDSHFILAGEELNGSVELGDVSAKVDMEIAKKEHIEESTTTHSGSSIEGGKVEITAKKEVTVDGSNIKGDNVTISAKTVDIQDSKNKVKIKKDGVTASVNADFGLKNDTASGKVTTTLDHKKENLDTEVSSASTIEGGSVVITADDVTVTGSNVTGNVDIIAKDNVIIQNADNISKYEQDSEKFIVGMGGKVQSSVVGLISKAKKLVDEREQLLGYLANPIAGYQKAKEIKAELEKNYNEIKRLVNNVKANNVDPASLGIAVSVDGNVSLNKQYINVLEKKSSAANISGGNINISAGNVVTIQNSNVTADKLDIDASKVDVVATENKKDAYEVNANVGAETNANIITETVTANVTAGVNHKQNHKKEQAGSKIQVGKLNINSKTDVNVANSTITAETGSINAENVNLISNADTETNFGIGVNGKINPETGDGKLDVATKIEHKQEIANTSTINGATVHGNIKKQDAAKVNLAANGNISTNGHGATGGLGLSTEVKKETAHTDGTYVVGMNGKLNVDENGQLNDSNLSSSVAGDVVIKPNKDLPLKDTSINFETNTNVNNEGVIGGNIASDIATAIVGKKELENGDVSGSINVNGHAELGGNSQAGLDQLGGKVDSHGTVTIAGKKQLTDGKVEGSLTINADSEAHAGLNKPAGASVNVNSDGTVTIAGKKLVGKDGKIDGSLTINTHTDTAANTAEGLTTLDGNANSNGTVTIAGKKQLTDGKVDGSLTINADSEAHAGLNKPAGASVNVNSDGTVTLAGKKLVGKDGKVDGSLTINTHTDTAANTAEGLTTLDGNANSNGTVTIAGKKQLTDGKVDGSLTINADSEAHAGLNKPAGVSVNVNSDGTVTVEGKKVMGKDGKVDGSLTINTHTDTAANTTEGLTKLDGNANSNGTVTIAGKKQLTDGKVEGSLTINADSEAHAGLNKPAGASVNVNSDGTVTVAGKKVIGKDGKVDGSLTINTHTDTAANTAEGLTTLDGNANSNGTVTIAGKKQLTDGKVEGSLTINAGSEAHAGLNKPAGASVNVNSDGAVTVAGKKVIGKDGKVDGSLTINTHTDTVANTAEGLTKLDGTGNASGVVNLNTDLVEASAMASAKASAGMNETPKIEPEGKVEVKKLSFDERARNFFKRLFHIK
ncbi:Hemolysin precursor [Phocoenobacter uteri]|uniref:Hemolysin n=1 Tax=Phocoenobacter uteri TaxID=146806 RepID=A0A379CA72_9PAST|nr:hemagglutinin repeat-containing protein [Phocoenobacter uteri]MDG6882428.1 hypothetical protein [Phocoenobacter uteri]SUB58586.1 Hemolysin precursor [Phocoenobacter uteri]